MSQRFLFALMLIASCTFLLFIYILPPNPLQKFIFAILCLLFDLIAFSTKLYMDFLVPMLKMRGRTIVVDDEEAFVLAPSGEAITVRKGGDIFASAFVKIPSYRSGTEMTPEEKVEFAKLFGRALTITNRPVRFGAQLYVINKDKYIGNIRDKLNEVEERYQRATMNKDISKGEAERIRGEVTMWHNLLDNVNKVKSHALDAFAMITEQGNTEEEAVTLVTQQANELVAGLSSIFGIAANVVVGEDILRYIEPDYMIPVVTETEQLRGKIAEEGV